MYVLKQPIENSFEKVGIKGKIFPAKELIGEDAGYVLIQTETGHETTIIEHESVFTYYILEGSGYFEINDEREECAAGDLIVIPKALSLPTKANSGCCLSPLRRGARSKKKPYEKFAAL